MPLSAKSARTIALLLPLDVDPVRARELVGELADAVIDDASPAKIDRLAKRLAAAHWADTLRPAVEEAIERRKADLRSELELLEDAHDEAARPVRANALAPAVVERLANDLADEVEEGWAALLELEEELEETPADERDALLDELPGTVSGAAGFTWEELQCLGDGIRSIAQAPLGNELEIQRHLDQLAQERRALATDERRRALRDALGKLAETVSSAFPLVAAAARELAESPPPRDPERDRVWVAATNKLAAQAAVRGQIPEGSVPIP